MPCVGVTARVESPQRDDVESRLLAALRTAQAAKSSSERHFPPGNSDRPASTSPGFRVPTRYRLPCSMTATATRLITSAIGRPSEFAVHFAGRGPHDVIPRVDVHRLAGYARGQIA